MPIHEYDPEEALRYLSRTLREKCEPLGEEIQREIDMGKMDLIRPTDLRDSETDLLGHRLQTSQKDQPSPFRQWRPYTSEEALEIALTILRSYFVVQPLLANSIVNNLVASLAPNAVLGESATEDVKIEFDLHTETPTDAVRSPITLKQTGSSEIDEQQQNLESLRVLVRFSGE